MFIEGGQGDVIDLPGIDPLTCDFQHFPELATLYGDMDCDSDVDGDDIQPFVLALTNPSQYASDFPGCDRLNGDCDKDGDLDGDDIQPFVDVLTSGNQPPQAVPEPASAGLLAIGFVTVFCRRKRK